MKGRRLDQDASAVSSVVAAVLLFALFTTASLLWTFQTLPVWIEDREDTHQGVTAERLAGLKAGLDSLATTGDAGPVTTTVSLAARPVPLLQKAPGAGTLAFEDGVTATASFSDPTVHMLSGSVLGAPKEDVNGDSFVDVRTLQALALRLQTSGIGPGGEGWVQVQITDGTDSVTARLSHVGQNLAVACNGNELRLTVTAGAETEHHVLLCDVGTALSGHAVDLLDNVYRVGAHAARLQSPRTMTFTDGGGTGSLQALWRDSDGLQQAAGSGASTSYALQHEGGRLVYTPRYVELDQQEVSFEEGAVIRIQRDGAAIHTDPSWTLTFDGTTAHLEWTLVELIGTGSLSGQGAAAVKARLLSVEEAVLDVQDATFTLTTPGAGAWRTFWEAEMLLADIGDATISGSDDTAQLSLGTGADVSTWRITLRSITAHVEVG